jgi:hypothetical protein
VVARRRAGPASDTTENGAQDVIAGEPDNPFNSQFSRNIQHARLIGQRSIFLRTIGIRRRFKWSAPFCVRVFKAAPILGGGR